MKVRKTTSNLIRASIFLAGLGILLISYELIALSFFPLLILLIPYFRPQIKSSKIFIEGGRYINEPFKVNLAIKAVGFGMMKIQHSIPEFFEILEGDNTSQNFVPGRKNILITYLATPTKRGIYNLNKIAYQTENPLLTGKKDFQIYEIPETDGNTILEVKQRIQKIIKVGRIRGIAKSPIPDIDISKIGVPGTDFREIKEYVPGDAVKFVNWKATARKGNLMVNKYDIEGKKAVWIFFDANRYMRHGTTIRNYLEAAVEAANSLTYYFTSRGYKVGVYLVGHQKIIYPDTGKRQFKRISDVLVQLEASDSIELMEHALHRSKVFISTYKPIIIYITRVEYSKPIKSILKISKMSKRKKIPVEVISLERHDQKELPELILKALQSSMKARIRISARILDWDINLPVSSMLMKEIWGR